jgi:hypothetical protein
MSTLIGSLGPDWMKKYGVKSPNDDLLRSWRDYLENKISQELGLSADLSIGDKTRFQFLGGSETHTVIEVESFARKAMDSFLHKAQSR